MPGCGVVDNMPLIAEIQQCDGENVHYVIMTSLTCNITKGLQSVANDALQECDIPIM